MWYFKRISCFKEALTVHTGYNSIRRSHCQSHVLKCKSRFKEALTVHTGYNSIRKSRCRSHVPKRKSCFKEAHNSAYWLQLHTKVTLSKSHSKAITMPMIFSLRGCLYGGEPAFLEGLVLFDEILLLWSSLL